MNKKLLFLFYCLFLSSIAYSQSLIDLFSLKKTRQENVEYQIHMLKKWNIHPDVIAVFKSHCKDSMINCKYNIDTHMCKYNTFSPIQFRVYESNGKLFTAWEYCFGNIKAIGTLKNGEICDIAHLPINRSVSFEQDKCLWKSISGSLTGTTSYQKIIVAYWDPYFGRSVRKMLQRIQQVIEKNPKDTFLFITVNYNGSLNVTTSIN